MNKYLLLFSFAIFSISLSQTPGGILGEDLWYKTDENTITNNEFTDYSSNHYVITRNNTIGENLFNFNHSLDFQGGNLSFPYSVEDMKVATIFMVYTNPENENWSLIHSDWISGIDNGNGENEKAFSYSTRNLVKEDFSLSYPDEGEPANALVNTLNWFDFNSNYINNNTGTGGESDVFIGKANSNAGTFGGSIPEFIIYRKALSKEERQRVESYLAIKYGITLTSDVDYFNSEYKKIWEKENNAVFGNRIFAIGRDDNSGLYQKQSTSSHTLNQEIILNADVFAENNGLNEAEFENDNFIFIGDNDMETEATVDDQESEVGVGDWQMHFIGRKWLVHPYGETTDEIETELRYNATQLFTQIHQDYEEQYWDDITVWLFINRSGDEQEPADFSDFNQVEHYMPDAIEDDHVVYTELMWDEDNTDFDQFTFAIGPKMLVDISLQEMKCTDTEGSIDIQLTFGEPDFDFRIYDEDENLIDSITGWATRNVSFVDIPNGWYTLEVEDVTGYIRTVEFEVSPTAGMNENLLEDQYQLTDGWVTIDASENVSATNITYEWFAEGISIGNIAEITLDKPGEYEVVLTNENGCQVSDTTTVTGNSNKTNGNTDETGIDAEFAQQSIKIYPNPTKANQEFTVEINLLEKEDVQIQIYDFSGSLIHNDTLEDVQQYKWNHKIFKAGSYMISVISQSQKFTKKLIIQ